MAGIYDWIRNIAYYILFLSVLHNILPGKKYDKYIRLFAGSVLILLVLKPITSLLQIEDQLAKYYEAFVFQYEAEELKKDLLGIEEYRLEEIMKQYENAIADDLTLMVEGNGYYVVKCQVEIEDDSKKENYGQVSSIFLMISLENTVIEPIIIGSQEIEEDSGVGKIRSNIASYYQLEETYVNIQMLEGEG